MHDVPPTDMIPIQRRMVITEVSPRTLVVGKPGADLRGYATLNGLKSDFRTITEAMAAIPLPSRQTPWDRKFLAQDRWTILVTPGVYEEDVRMKPNVSIVGLGSDSVYIFRPRDRPWEEPLGDGRRAIVYLNYKCSVNNVVLGKTADMTGHDYAFWNYDWYGVGKEPNPAPGGREFDVSGMGLNNVWIWPYGFETGKGKALLLEGNWHTAMFNNFGSTQSMGYGFDLELNGVGQNADTHFIGCFFDALYLEGVDGGCALVRNCSEVHFRNSFLRIGARGGGHVQGSCVRAEGMEKEAMVWLEHSSLQANGPSSSRALWLRGNTRCAIHFSAISSVEKDGTAVVDLAKWPPGSLPWPP